MRHLLAAALGLAVWVGSSEAQVISLLGESGRGIFAGRDGAGTAAEAQVMPSALFVGRAEGGFFADLPAHEPAYRDAPVARLYGSDVEIIRALIQEAESRRHGYDAVQWRARIKPPKRPTQMTLAEIFEWIRQTPGQPHAIGRYQFIPATLRRVVAKTGMSANRRFTAEVQDRLADVLLAEAGLQRFRAGELSRVAFMNNLAKIWAGLPNASGRSHYHGYAGNKASISWSRFDAVMQQVERKRG